MMPWDWIGMVTIRSDTRRRTSITGTISRRPGSRTPMTRPRRKSTPFSYCWTIRTDRASPTSTSTATTTTVSQPLMSYPFLAGTADRGDQPVLLVRVLGAVAGWLGPSLGEQRGRRRPSGDAPARLTQLGVVSLAACRRDGRSAGADLDALGSGFLHFGHQDLEYAVVGRGLDSFCHHMGGQGDRPPEGAVALGDVECWRPGRGRTAALRLALQAERVGEHRAHLGHLVLRAAQVLERVPPRHGGHPVSLLHGPCGPAARGRTP